MKAFKELHEAKESSFKDLTWKETFEQEPYRYKPNVVIDELAESPTLKPEHVRDLLEQFEKKQQAKQVLEEMRNTLDEAKKIADVVAARIPRDKPLTPADSW